MSKRSIFEDSIKKLDTENKELQSLFRFLKQLLIEERDPKIILSILEERLEEIKQGRLRW